MYHPKWYVIADMVLTKDVLLREGPISFGEQDASRPHAFSLAGILTLFKLIWNRRPNPSYPWNPPSPAKALTRVPSAPQWTRLYKRCVSTILTLASAGCPRPHFDSSAGDPFKDLSRFWIA